MVAPDGCQFGQISEPGALGQESIERIIQDGETLRTDSLQFVLLQQAAEEHHGAVGGDGPFAIIPSADIARRYLGRRDDTELTVYLVVGSGMDKSAVGMGMQIIDLQLQFVGTMPIVITIEHCDCLASVAEDLLVEQEGVLDYAHILLAAVVTNTRVGFRQTVADRLSPVGGSIVADVDSERFGALLRQDTPDALLDKRLVVICGDTNGYHLSWSMALSMVRTAQRS